MTTKNFIPSRAKPIVCIIILLGLWQASVCFAEQPQWPLKGQVSSHFGWRQDPLGQGTRFHAGLDIAAPKDTPIVATQRAVVAFSGPYRGYGNVVALAHGKGLYTLYGHASTILVHSDQVVEKGQVIATVGSTGRSTGPHLHFEVHENGRYKNPREYLAGTQPAEIVPKSSPFIADVASKSVAKGVTFKTFARRHRNTYDLSPYKAVTTVFDTGESLYGGFD